MVSCGAGDLTWNDCFRAANETSQIEAIRPTEMTDEVQAVHLDWSKLDANVSDEINALMKIVN